jgi:DNA recombination protein RmuC
MENSLLILLLLLGIVLGALSAWLIAKFKFTSEVISEKELRQKYVSREVHEALQKQEKRLGDDLKEKESEHRAVEKMLASKEQMLLNLEDKLAGREGEFEMQQKRAQLEFENIANRLLEEKSQKFTLQNRQQLGEVLNPLKEKIKEFREDIEKRFLEETKDIVSLKSEIEHLHRLNLQLSSDANKLASALKGDSKVQGDWGEFRLELLLERAGLVKGAHFLVQPSFKDESGKDKRPDFVIRLPEEKHLVIDSKVSLTAYEKYFKADTDKKRAKHLKAHIESIRNHIKDLSSKNYQQLYQINSPDYLLLFIPLEPAFSVALEKDSRLFLDALEKNIVLVTTSTLLATLRTVSYIWKQENQKNNVLEIARQSGLLYDKFVNFVEDLKMIGQRLEGAQNAYDSAMNKLVESKKFGDTLVGRAQKIKELGAKTSKALPKELVDIIEDEDGLENGSEAGNVE